MRKSTTLSWIEQAEAARVLIAAACEEAAEPPRRRIAADALAKWCDCLRFCLTPPQSSGCPAFQLQPVRVRAAPRRPVDEDRNYGCHW
jgi:hypothetical protein